MTSAFERLSDRQRERLFAALSAGDADGEVGASNDSADLAPRRHRQ